MRYSVHSLETRERRVLRVPHVGVLIEIDKLGGGCVT
jgi:hypothetical protein